MVRWGILGTANIVRRSFAPAVRATGGGTLAIVASRNAARAEEFATELEIDHGVAGYERVLEDDRIQAVYIALPNSLHVEWTLKALRAGKAVLCEKPLALNRAEVEQVMAATSEHSLLWEAFVFPFQPQALRVQAVLESGAIGEIREIQSELHFPLVDRQDIRFRPELGGGALHDTGCYPLQLADWLWEEEAVRCLSDAVWAPEGVDAEMAGVVTYPGGRRLIFSCGMISRRRSFGRILGTEGEMRLTHPFHPGPNDSLVVMTGDRIETEDGLGQEPSFTAAIRHIQAVVQGEEGPRHLARRHIARTTAVRECLYQVASES